MKLTTLCSGRFQDKKQTSLQHATIAQNAAEILSPAATAVKKWQICATRPAVLSGGAAWSAPNYVPVPDLCTLFSDRKTCYFSGYKCRFQFWSSSLLRMRASRILLISLAPLCSP